MDNDNEILDYSQTCHTGATFYMGTVGSIETRGLVIETSGLVESAQGITLS